VAGAGTYNPFIASRLLVPESSILSLPTNLEVSQFMKEFTDEEKPQWIKDAESKGWFVWVNKKKRFSTISLDLDLIDKLGLVSNVSLRIVHLNYEDALRTAEELTKKILGV
jgi:hypothetical protein